MSNGKVYDNSFNSWLIKKTLSKMGQYFPKPYKTFGRDVNVKVDLSNYVTKTDLRETHELIRLV